MLIALGLFYEAPIDSRLKSEERILERLTSMAASRAVVIDPRIDATSGRLRIDWPDDLNNLYDAWPAPCARTMRPSDDAVGDLCNRLSFMYGMPYHHHNLAEVIHGSKSARGGACRSSSAPFRCRCILHAARNLRRGHATYFPASRVAAAHR